MSLELHHDSLYPLNDILSQATLGSDPTCRPELRFGGCHTCFERDCKIVSLPRTCEFNQPCPKDNTTAARLGGNGPLATHMVKKILTLGSVQRCFEGHAVWSVCGALILHDITIGWFSRTLQTVKKQFFSELECCGTDFKNPECFNIDIEDDPYYKDKIPCHTFTRSNHWRVRYCVFFLTKNFPTFQCQSAGILQSKHTKGCLGPCFHWFLNPKLLTTKKRFLFLSGRKVHSELQGICFLSHFPLWRNWCFVCHCQ